MSFFSASNRNLFSSQQAIKSTNLSGRDINLIGRNPGDFVNEEILFRKAKRTFARIEQIIKIHNFLPAPFEPSVAPVLSLRTAALF